MALDVSRLVIVQYPDPSLREIARPIDTIDDTVRAVAARMFELMHEADGAGLAATQVGLPWRLFVTRGDDRYPDRVYINPRLAGLGGDMDVRPEGCLSLPGITLDIRRPSTATVTAQDLDNRPFTLADDDLLARVWQHEHDHINGVLIIDKMTPIDRIANRKLLKELESAAGQGAKPTGASGRRP